RRLSGISARGPLTLVFELSRPYHDFPAVLTHPSLVPLPESAVVDPDRFLRVPVGNGPFHIAQPWTPGDPILLRAYAGFIDTPNLDGIRFLSFPDAAASWLLFRDEEIDVAEVPAGEIAAATEEFGDRAFQPFLATYNFGLNVAAPALDNLRLRRAINHAIDREAIAQNVYRGSMEPARGIVPAGMPGFLENICVDLCDHRPDLSARLVRDLRPRERLVRLEYAGEQPHPRVAQMARRDLEDVGLRVSVRRYGFAKYVRRLQSDDHHVYRLGWIAEVPTADAFLYPLFGSESPDNHSGFASEEVDRLLARAHATRSDAKRVQIYIQAEKAIMRRTPIVPVGSFVTHWAAHESVTDLVFDQMGGFDAVDVSLAT
ncbi:MAG: ABC transporter substrate-binding protein, partial [Actinomycetota bacterium]|nr:ABC transporter substrate-binding protein [Actinomycetota bacterium]